MGDGEIEFSDTELFANSGFGGDLSGLVSTDSFFDEILRNTHACTHTHTCNPPGPDNIHTHTCFHTHTQLFAAAAAEENSGEKSEKSENHIDASSLSSRKKRPIGNREAVKKYREKKKAHTAYLEEQVVQLRVLNQRLVKRLQGQAALEAEVIRLRALLSEFRGRIEGELGTNYQKTRLGSVVGASKGGDVSVQPLPCGCFANSVNISCDADVPCLHPSSGMQEDSLVQREQVEALRLCGICDVGTANCLGMKV